MTTMETANRLVALCSEGRSEEALDTLYWADAVSIEAMAPPGGEAISKGIAAIKAKGQWWVSNHEIHSAVVAGPWPHGDQFIVGFKYEVTFKPTKTRIVMEEMALYSMAKGKIVKEEFFYKT
jgi:hypothetical protein